MRLLLSTTLLAWWSCSGLPPRGDRGRSSAVTGIERLSLSVSAQGGQDSRRNSGQAHGLQLEPTHVGEPRRRSTE